MHAFIFCKCTCSLQLSMFDMERCSTITIIINIIITSYANRFSYHSSLKLPNLWERLALRTFVIVFRLLWIKLFFSYNTVSPWSWTNVKIILHCSILYKKAIFSTVFIRQNLAFIALCHSLKLERLDLQNQLLPIWHDGTMIDILCSCQLTMQEYCVHMCETWSQNCIYSSSTARKQKWFGCIHLTRHHQFQNFFRQGSWLICAFMEYAWKACWHLTSASLLSSVMTASIGWHNLVAHWGMVWLMRSG